jgi:hypothetical protein
MVRCLSKLPQDRPTAKELLLELETGVERMNPILKTEGTVNNNGGADAS